jgi:hypothetical protein
LALHPRKIAARSLLRQASYQRDAWQASRVPPCFRQLAAPRGFPPRRFAMKKLSILVIALSFGFAAPVFACPSEDAAKTAKKADKVEKKETAEKAENTDKTKPAETAKKASDKVSMK